MPISTVLCHHPMQWRRGRVRGTGAIPQLNFSLLENFRCPKIFFKQYKIRGPEIRHFVEFLRKIATVSTDNLFCWKFVAACQKISTSCAPAFLTHDAADLTAVISGKTRHFWIHASLGLVKRSGGRTGSSSLLWDWTGKSRGQVETPRRPPERMADAAKATTVKNSQRKPSVAGGVVAMHRSSVQWRYMMIHNTWTRQADAPRRSAEMHLPHHRGLSYSWENKMMMKQRIDIVEM